MATFRQLLKKGVLSGVTHCVSSMGGFYKANRPVRVWKKVYAAEVPAGTSRWPRHWQTRRKKVIPLTLPKGVFFYTKGHKCRAARLISRGSGYSVWNGVTEYKKNKVIKPQYGLDGAYLDCASGIHFFFSKREASRW